MNQGSKPVMWCWRELCRAVGATEVEGPDIFGISIDSRTTQEGDLFVALSGKARPQFNIHEDSGRDGHDFINDAFAKGAVGALVHHSIESELQTIQVEETLDALWQMAGMRRSQLTCPVISLTGSSGKTTLKSFLSEALGGQSGSDSFNNHIGVPLSLARTLADTRTAAVLEIGTNHPGEISQLAQLVEPTIAVVLNVGNAHIGNFKGVEELRAEKLSIAEGLKNDGVFIVNADLRPFVSEQFASIEVRTFGTTALADFRYQLDSDDGHCTIHTSREEFAMHVPGNGHHRAETLCATAAVIETLGLSAESHLKRISNDLPPGRGNVFVENGIKVIDESYNANPASMRQCLRNLIKETSDRRIAIVGDMNELGDSSEALHQSLAPLLNQLDGVILAGENLYEYLIPHLEPDIVLTAFDTLDGLPEYCSRLLRPKDTVLVKGSNTVFWKHDFVPKLLKELKAKGEKSSAD